MDTSKPTRQVVLTRETWTKFNFKATEGTATGTEIATLNADGHKDEGSIILSDSQRTLHFSRKGRERTWLLRRSSEDGTPDDDDSAIVIQGKRLSQVRRTFLIECDGKRIFMARTGMWRDNYVFWHVPEGAEVDGGKERDSWEIVGDFRKGAVTKGVYDVKFLEDVSLECQFFGCILALTFVKRDHRSGSTGALAGAGVI